MFAFIKGEQKQFQSLHPRNTWNIWKDTQYSEVRNILCNIWMTLIFGIGGLQLSNEISLDSVQKAWEAVPSHGAFWGSEKLLNILERLYRVVCTKYTIYEGLELAVPDFPALNDFSGLINEFGEEKEQISQHGRSRCTCRLRPSTASAADKNLRIEEIRSLLCFTWADPLNEILKKRGNVPIYIAGDGPFQNTLVDPGAKLGKENEVLHPVETRRLNAMLLTLWKIVCLSDPPIYLKNPVCQRHRLRALSQKLGPLKKKPTHNSVQTQPTHSGGRIRIRRQRLVAQPNFRLA